MINTVHENQFKGDTKQNDLIDAVDLIRKKFEGYEAKKRQKDEVIKALQGKDLTLHNHLEIFEIKINKQEQYPRRKCFLVHRVNENKF